MRRPLLLYDADCGFCRRWVSRWRSQTGARVRYAPYQRPGLLLAHRVPRERARRSVQLLEPGGRRSQGARAVFRTLLRARSPAVRALARAALLPGAIQIAEVGYRRVANHRALFSRLERTLGVAPRAPSRHRRVRRVFLAGLGVSYLAAFTSLRAQVLGLYGEQGILPVQDQLDALAALPTREKLRNVPTLFWLDASDRALLGVCRAGQLCALGLILGVMPRFCAAMAWVNYLSLVSVGEDFLSFQWDALLLEAGLHAALVAPPTRRALAREEPGAAAVLLLRWLVFRLHFESGLVKLRSPDRTWRERTALSHYFETAPLPTRAGWRAHHLPAGWHTLATRATLWIECGAPFLAFGPRAARNLAFAALTGLQGLIALTGNYGFFNLLTGVLNVWLLDDLALPGPSRARAPSPRRVPFARRAAVALGALALGTLSLAGFARAFGGRGRFSRWVERVGPVLSRLAPVHRALGPFRCVNSYGPFSVMTTERPEIAVEGSDDLREWREYPFKFKMGDPARAPRWVAPHMPRLDWQMWFAALNGVPSWFVRFAARILQGSAPVLGLLGPAPFDHPPRYVRATLYDYRETSPAERRGTGRWWKRERVGTYLPPAALR